MVWCVAIMLLPGFARAQEKMAWHIGGGDIVLSPAPAEPLRSLVNNWVSKSARAVAGYYGRFPVAHLEVQLRLIDGHGVRGGQTFGWDGALTKIALGRESTAEDFADDWMLTHEMVHLAFPDVAERHHWMEEGIATYVEPIARERAGDLTPEKVWGDMMDGLPKGLPAAGDRGLDFTPTWGRTYWGGALFCLLADIEIRKRTGNNKGLEDALRAILRSGGNIETHWELTRALEVGDGATGTHVLRELYDKMKASPAPVNLDALWRELGVQRNAGAIVFDDAAPMAAIRRAITPAR